MWTKGTRIIGGLMLALAAASCTVKDTEAPALAGPSTMATDLVIQAIPDTILQDGASQSSVTIDARGPDNQQIRGLSLRVDMRVGATLSDFGTLSARTVVTGDDGRARVIYTAPPRPVDSGPGTTVTLVITPIGGDYRQEFRREVDIRVIPPGVILPPNGAPQPAFTVSPTSPLAFQTVTFDASGTRDEGVLCDAACSYAWTFGDGGSATGQVVTHDFRAPGTYIVTLRVTDARGGTASTAQSVVVAAGTPPTASFVYSPTAPRTSQDIFFTAEASRAANGRRIVSYDWNFGSGRTGTGVATSKRYDTPGSYVVTLTVTDDASQQGTVSQTITVIP